MKLFSSILVVLLSVISITSCKKGCTDPYAKNYNPKKTIDKGNCDVYQKVTLNSILIQTIPERNSNNNPWDSGLDGDTDNDGTHPDLYVEYRAEGGYKFQPDEYLPTVNPSNVDWLQSLAIPISVYDWKNDKGFYVYFYEVDQGSTYNFMDSVLISPFELNAKNNRFKDTMAVVKGQYKFTANMVWK